MSPNPPLAGPQAARRSPFTPPEALPPSRPIAKPEEGPRRHEGLAAFGAGLIVLLMAGALAGVLYLAFG